MLLCAVCDTCAVAVTVAVGNDSAVPLMSLMALTVTPNALLMLLAPSNINPARPTSVVVVLLIDTDADNSLKPPNAVSVNTPSKLGNSPLPTSTLYVILPAKSVVNDAERSADA
jgi:hypothetical protein